MNMKTPNLLTLIGIALAAAAMNVGAQEALLTPRAMGNQIKFVPTATTDRNLAAEKRIVTASPRSLGNQVKSAAPVETRDLAAGACAIGSPRQVEQIGKIASASCCQRAPSACTAPKACCAAK